MLVVQVLLPQTALGLLNVPQFGVSPSTNHSRRQDHPAEGRMAANVILYAELFVC